MHRSKLREVEFDGQENVRTIVGFVELFPALFKSSQRLTCQSPPLTSVQRFLHTEQSERNHNRNEGHPLGPLDHSDAFRLAESILHQVGIDTDRSLGKDAKVKCMSQEVPESLLPHGGAFARTWN